MVHSETFDATLLLESVQAGSEDDEGFGMAQEQAKDPKIMPKLDPDEIEAGIIAAKEAASKFTFMGVNVGSRITDDQYREIVTAIVAAVENYRSGASI